MIHASRFALVALILCCALPAGAQPMGPRSLMGPPAFLEHVFPPELVMRHQRDIGLTPAQQEAITQAMRETQKKLVDLQWQFEAESQELAKILGGQTVDEAAALAQAEKVMGMEQQIKKAHLGLLIGIKNQLSPTQQEKLRKLRSDHGRHRGPPFRQ